MTWGKQWKKHSLSIDQRARTRIRIPFIRALRMNSETESLKWQDQTLGERYPLSRCFQESNHGVASTAGPLGRRATQSSGVNIEFQEVEKSCFRISPEKRPCVDQSDQ